ncbi:MAG TPA: pyridoxal-phosphate dependent enzyme [Mycobacterium sp.]|nr:pyridoxal-phosphate dependent enzyme [Mycobacterium sp.]
MCSPGQLADALRAQPRIEMASLPTPLTFAPRFSAAVGGEVWLKRDDLTGLALGGNKARKIEYLLGKARAASDVDTVVTVGAAQSNHARTVAAAARIAGWECHLVLGGQRPARPSGNLVLDVALGAAMHFVDTESWDALEARADELAADLRSRGRHPIVIPMGGSTAVGALGFVGAYLELLGQLDTLGVDPVAILHATSTGGTQAGLDFAHRVLGSGPDVIGVGVAKTGADLRAEVSRLEAELGGILGLDAGPADPTVLDGYMGEAYAVPTPGCEAAFASLASTEAVLTDFVYSAKALHAVVDRAASAGGPVVFWHTGGVPALFSASTELPGWRRLTG